MPEIEEENPSNDTCNNNNPCSLPEDSPTVMMSMDIVDLDRFFSNDSWPSFILSPSDQPLWDFSDDNDQPAGNSTLTSTGPPLRLPSNTSDPVQVTEEPYMDEQNIRLPEPRFGLTPPDYPDRACIIKERMIMALRFLKELTEQSILAQLWAPIRSGDRYVLTTSGLPFLLGSNSTGLLQYRMVSLMYMYSLESVTGQALGLPGRVFLQKLPEWTPNVQYYSHEEYPQLVHALNYNIRGTLAMPVFDPSGQSCVGVLELVLTSQKINYAPEVDRVCKALEAVDLKSSDILDRPNTQICNKSRRNALAEILEILTVVCETYNLPLAQTWVPCRHQSVLAHDGGLTKKRSRFDENCVEKICMSTTDVAFYVVDAHMWGFREACSEHHLQKGQGVAGRAFATRGSCFSEDITNFSKTEYPLVHYARMFELAGSFAICLKSSHTGDDDYVLEFFFPFNVVDSKDQEALLGTLLTTMKQHFRSLKVASGEENRDDQLHIIKATTLSEQVTRTEISKGKHKTALISLSREAIEQQYGWTQKEAAKRLNVCLSTMKRKCKEHGIYEWPGPKVVKKKIEYGDEIRAIEDSPAVNHGPIQDASTLTIKAEHGDDLVKFKLPFQTTLVALKEEISKSFDLRIGTFRLKYYDEDKDLVLISNDQHLRDCIESSRPAPSIRLHVVPDTRL